MNVVFTVDYTGPLTGGRYYPQGDVVSLSPETAILLYRAGVVKLENPPPVLVSKPTPDDPFQVGVAAVSVLPAVEAELETESRPPQVVSAVEVPPLDTDAPAEAEPPAVDAGAPVTPAKVARKTATKRASKKATK